MKRLFEYHYFGFVLEEIGTPICFYYKSFYLNILKFKSYNNFELNIVSFQELIEPSRRSSTNITLYLKNTAL